MTRCRYCSYTARWEGLCLACYQRSGRMEVRRAEELARLDRERIERQQQREADALGALLRLGDQQLPWWDVSERLNRAGHRNRGAPWSPGSARGAYLAAREAEWG